MIGAKESKDVVRSYTTEEEEGGGSVGLGFEMGLLGVVIGIVGERMDTWYEGGGTRGRVWYEGKGDRAWWVETRMWKRWVGG